MDAAVIARADLLQALAALTPQERMILSLSILYGYTTKQISQMLRCPHGTVSSKLHRSLQKLKKTDGREVMQMNRSNPAEDFSQIKKQLRELDRQIPVPFAATAKGMKDRLTSPAAAKPFYPINWPGLPLLCYWWLSLDTSCGLRCLPLWPRMTPLPQTGYK